MVPLSGRVLSRDPHVLQTIDTMPPRTSHGEKPMNQPPNDPDPIADRSRRRISILTRIVVLVVIALVATVTVAWARAMTTPSSLPLSIRTVEWVRDNGGAGFVNFVEHVYYTTTAPETGGADLTSLPAFGVAGSVPASGPPRVIGAISPALPGEGVWRGTGRTVLGGDPVRVTVFRPDAAYPRQLAYAAWIDTSRIQLELYPGRKQPPNANPRGPMEVPVAMRAELLATFNSGYTYKDSLGGFALRGRTIEPMRAGQATVIEYTDGRIDIIDWNGGATVGADVVLARQNLPMLVKDGRPGPDLANEAAGGFSLGNAVRVWRSALGVDAGGNLIYLAAPGQTVGSLAGVMVRAGAVRAMMLDINSQFPTFITYGRAGTDAPTMQVPNDRQLPTRYLTPDDRDFFAVYAAQRLKSTPRI